MDVTCKNTWILSLCSQFLLILLAYFRVFIWSNVTSYLILDYLYDTDFEEVDKLLMQYKKKKPTSFPFSCFPFMRSKKHKMRDNLRTGPTEVGTKLEMTNLGADCWNKQNKNESRLPQIFKNILKCFKGESVCGINFCGWWYLIVIFQALLTFFTNKRCNYGES